MKPSILIFIFIPMLSFSQLIKSNQTDAFTHQKRIVTDEIYLSGMFAHEADLDGISYYTVNDNIFVVLHGGGRKSGGSILKDDIALLITENDTIVIKSAGLQTSYGKSDPFYYDHQYLIANDDLIKLSKNKLLAIRRYNSRGIFNMAVKEKYQEKLMKLSDVLLKEMSK